MNDIVNFIKNFKIMDLKRMTKREIARMIDSLNLRLNGFTSMFLDYVNYYTKSELIDYYNVHFL